MIKANQEILDEVQNWNWDDTYVVADFDRTLSSSDSITSWGLLSATSMVPKEFIQRENELYNYYRPMEIDSAISPEKKNNLMLEWWRLLLSALREYEFSKDKIDNLMNYSALISLREGVKELFESLYLKNVPIIIISAGLGNTIEHFLESNGINYPNVFIVSNFLEYEDGKVKGTIGKIIHSLNKGEELLTDEQKAAIGNRKHVILLGDQIPDINMISEEKRKKALRIAFGVSPKTEEDFSKYYNVLCTKDTSFIEVMEVLPSLGIKRS